MGREVTKLMSAAGHAVSVLGRRPPPEEDAALQGARHFVADLGDAAALRETLGQIVASGGRLSYLVFCQRYRGDGDAWTGEFEITLTATKEAIESLADQFAEDGDKGVVVVSSVFGDFVGKGQPVGYHVCKAGLNQLMRYYAVNLGRKGIRVNAVTAFTYLKEESKEFYLGNEDLLGLYERIVPLGRMATAQDCARAAAFLCSPEAGFVNGQNLYVDGGLSLVWPETLARDLTGI